MNRTASLVSALFLACGGGGGACNWVSLAANSLNYRTTQRGEAGNVVARGAFVYATLAEDGIAVIDAATGRTIVTVPAPADQSIDDLALAGDLLFALDARPPGHLSVYSLSDPTHPQIVGAPREVAVGPFSGVSAADGLCVVSGGTSQLTLWRYDSSGTITGPLATADLGRGQPDVLLGPQGVIYVSTHYWGPYFGLDIARFDSAQSRVQRLGKLPLPGAGFTTGGAKPANFPIESALLGSDTLLVASARGLDVLDVQTPSQPRLLTTIDLGGPAVNVDVERRTAAVVVGGATPAIVFLDFTTNSPHQRRVELGLGTNPTGVALGGPRAAVAAGSAGVALFTK
jgi:hypothetical protein